MCESAWAPKISEKACVDQMSGLVSFGSYSFGGWVGSRVSSPLAKALLFWKQ